jgi:hypothetical protein
MLRFHVADDALPARDDDSALAVQTPLAAVKTFQMSKKEIRKG